MSPALALVAPTANAQSVGVTSSTVGDPLGKPPWEAERVLHVGVDVKANELITAGAADRAHLVFLDGTALSVGPEARLVIDSFVYDADHRLGELSLSATRGVFRFVGGNISKKKAVQQEEGRHDRVTLAFEVPACLDRPLRILLV